MSRGHGQLRQSQVITTYGPGALIDLPNPRRDRRRARVLAQHPQPRRGRRPETVRPSAGHHRGRGSPHVRPRHRSRPSHGHHSTASGPGPSRSGSSCRSPTPATAEAGLGAWRIASRSTTSTASTAVPSFRHGSCGPARGAHVDDLDWVGFVHRGGERCARQLRLAEHGTSGDLADLVVRCDCGQSRRLYEATEIDQRPLGTCRGKRPWLGLDTDEDCTQPSRLLIRTASNAYFAQVVSVLSLPDRGTAVERAVARTLGRPPHR